MKKYLALMAIIALAAIGCFEPDDETLSPFLGTHVSPMCGDVASEVLLLVDTSARMGEPSGYLSGSKDIPRAELVTDALKRTLPHIKKVVDFGLITFPFVDDRDGNPAPDDACTVSDRMVEPRSPYGWIVSQLEHVKTGGNASVAAALLKAYEYFKANPADEVARGVVLFTAGGDECGGDILAAIDLLASINVTTIVISYENATDAELLAEAALRGGHLFRQNDFWGVVKELTDKTGHEDLQTMLESAEFEEVCDGIDNDCDGLVDENFDADGDGWASCMGDVDDDPLVYPGATDYETPSPYVPGEVIDWYQGPDSNGDPIDPILSDPTDGLTNEPGPGQEQFPLGYYGYLEVAFACPVRNGDGPDLRIFDSASDGAWDLETAEVYAWSVADRAWVLLGTATNNGYDVFNDTANEFDLGDLPWAARFRIVNTSPVAPDSPLSNGFDVDGVYSLQECASCDSRDNDNDGVVDGGYGVGIVCTQLTGVCTSQGIAACSDDGTHTVCEAPTIVVKDEVCDGLDNDCDGTVDDIVIACSTRCGTGHRTCTAGNWGECVVEVPALELCDGLDNDCDGAIDEDFPLGDACRVGSETCGQTGVYVCSADKLDTTCQVTGQLTGSPETCNGVDDDCNGVPDDGDDLCADGEVCFMGQCVLD